MVKKFAKLVFIEGNEILGVDNIIMNFNLDNIISDMTLNIPEPYSRQDYIGKQKKIEIYCGYIPEESIPSKSNLTKRFDGYITGITKTVDKNNRILSVSAMDKLEFLTRNELLYKLQGDSSLQVVLELLIQQITEQYPDYDLSYYIGADTINTIPDLSGSTNAIEILRQIKKDIIVYIYYHPIHNMIGIISPYFTQYLFKQANVLVYDFNITNIVGSFNYGDITNNVNKVVYVGFGGRKGVATDYSALALGQKAQELRYRDMTTGSKEELEEKARNKLLELQRNHNLQFTSPLVETLLTIMPGELCRINDEDEFTGKEIFIIKSVTITVAKNDLKVDITAVAHTLTEFPEDLVLNKFGITDEDTLYVIDKEPQGSFE